MKRAVMQWAMAASLASVAMLPAVGMIGCGGDSSGSARSDAQAGKFTVRGMALGMLEPIQLELEHPRGREIIEVGQEGDSAFSFAAALSPGDSYKVALVGSPRCALERGVGTVASYDPAIRVTCEGAVQLVDLALFGVVPELGFEPTKAEYTIPVPLLQQRVSVIAVAPYPETVIEVAGMPALSGEPSPPLELALGTNPIAVMVRHPSGLTHEYRVIAERATKLMHYTYVKASNTGNEDQLGTSVAVDGDVLVVGAPMEDSAAQGVGGNQNDDSALGSGAAYVFRRRGTTWVQEAYLKAANSGIGDGFGASVAVSGDLIAIGAPEEDSAATGVGGDGSDDSSQTSGAVYLFRRQIGGWRQEAYLKPSNTGESDRFGASVAVTGDTVIVGAPGEDSSATGVGGNREDDSAPLSGAVYVFRQSNGTWAEEAYLKAFNTGMGDQFGASVAMAGELMVVGAPLEDSGATGVDGNANNESISGSGAAYVFRRGPGGELGGWVQEAYLKASNTGMGDRFGSSVAIAMTHESALIVVGAHSEDSSGTGVGGAENNDNAAESGAAYLFRRTAPGQATAWVQEAYLKPSNTGASDRFGTSVAVAGDFVAVGATGEDSSAKGVNGAQNDESATQSGAVYLYRRKPTGQDIGWAQDAYIKPSNTDPNDRTGQAVALSLDTLAVGASMESSAAKGINGEQSDNTAPGSGAVYVLH